jgi:hypothetical protein
MIEPRIAKRFLQKTDFDVRAAPPLWKRTEENRIVAWDG